MGKAIILDLDGTVADLYSVPNWLPMLQRGNAAPYRVAKPINKIQVINGLLSALQGYGYQIEVVSWLAKGSTDKAFDNTVRRVKRLWVKKYLPCVQSKNVHVVKHGTNKWRVSNYKGGILFDDEPANVEQWRRQTSSGTAYCVTMDTDTLLRELENLVIQCIQNRD